MIKKNGFTLVEILLVVGIISLAIVSIYTIFNIASDWQKSSNEAAGLQNAINRIERATSSTGIFTGVTLGTLPIVGGGFISSISMKDVVSPNQNTLHFIYKSVGSRVCSSFVTKMLGMAGNVSAIINGTVLANLSEFKDIASQCTNDSNDITIALNSNISVAGLTPVIPSADADALYEAAHPRTIANVYYFQVMIPSLHPTLVFSMGGTPFLSYSNAMSWFLSTSFYAAYVAYNPVIVLIPACTSGYEPAKNSKLELINPSTCQAI